MDITRRDNVDEKQAKDNRKGAKQRKPEGKIAETYVLFRSWSR
jgi:hypothetical protein